MLLKNNKYITLLYILFLGMLAVTELKAQDTERILNFHSDIKVEQSGRVLVTETIRINVTGESINRGISRTLPFYQTDISDDSKKRIDITVLSVKKDGKPEKYSTTINDNYLDIYTGEDDFHLSPNIYEYKIQYESRGNVDFFDNYDQLSYNVTGNYLVFPIDSASATIHVPQGAKVINSSCATSYRELETTSCHYSTDGDSIVNFYYEKASTHKRIFIVTTSFTPNIIKRSPPPSLPSKVFVLWHMYSKLILMLTSFVLLTGYFIAIYRRFYPKRDKLTIVPTSNPPGGRSTGSIRYIFNKKIDAKAITTTILSLAVKKAITIDNENSTYTFTKRAMPESLTEDEKSIYKTLFVEDQTSISLQKKYNSVWDNIYIQLLRALSQIDKISDYYPDKVIYLVKGAFIIIGFMVLWFLNLSFLGEVGKDDIIITCILSLITILLSAFFRKSVTSILVLLFWIPVIIIQYFFVKTHGVIYLYSFSFIYLLVLVEFLFAKRFNPSTDKGLELTADRKGFEIYLKTKNESSLNLSTIPAQTPQQFEKMLPYAVALNLEKEWTEKFSDILKTNNYQPIWLAGKPIVSYTNFIQSLSYSLTYGIEINITPKIKKRDNDESNCYKIQLIR